MSDLARSAKPGPEGNTVELYRFKVASHLSISAVNKFSCGDFIQKLGAQCCRDDAVLCGWCMPRRLCSDVQFIDNLPKNGRRIYRYHEVTPISQIAWNR